MAISDGARRGRLDGARAEHLSLLAEGSGMAFVSRKGLEAECAYTWRSVLSGGLLRSRVWPQCARGALRDEAKG